MPSYNPVVFTSPAVIEMLPVSTSTVHSVLIPFYANYYGINVNYMDAVVKCESNYMSSAVGDHGTSFGVAQLHYPSTKGFTIPQALNAMISLNYMAKALKYGTDHWTCQQNVGTLAYSSSP